MLTAVHVADLIGTTIRELGSINLRDYEMAGFPAMSVLLRSDKLFPESGCVTSTGNAWELASHSYCFDRRELCGMTKAREFVDLVKVRRFTVVRELLAHLEMKFQSHPVQRLPEEYCTKILADEWMHETVVAHVPGQPTVLAVYLHCTYCWEPVPVKVDQPVEVLA